MIFMTNEKKLKTAMQLERMACVLVALLMSLGSLCAQELQLKDFRHDPSDAAASVNMVNDLNGSPGSLIKIDLVASGVEFEGDVVKSIRKGNEYWVYMLEGSTWLNIKSAEYIAFRYEFPPLKKLGTYVMQLLGPDGPSSVNSATGSDNSINGHEYVDLGLSVKWATCNVGASSPGDYGDYFAWGETSPKSSYDWENLKYRTEGDSYDNVKFSKYVTERRYGTKDNRTRLELSDDAARANWGGSWRTPTYDELDELKNQCIWQWTTVNGHNGYRVTSKRNGRSIFLPAAGFRNGSSSYSVGSRGDYWSSSLCTSDSYNAYYLGFHSSVVYWYYSGRRYGLSVRAVSE